MSMSRVVMGTPCSTAAPPPTTMNSTWARFRVARISANPCAILFRRGQLGGSFGPSNGFDHVDEALPRAQPLRRCLSKRVPHQGPIDPVFVVGLLPRYG